MLLKISEHLGQQGPLLGFHLNTGLCLTFSEGSGEGKAVQGAGSRDRKLWTGSPAWTGSEGPKLSAGTRVIAVPGPSFFLCEVETAGLSYAPSSFLKSHKRR